jgi:glutamate/tyrosine decarboxylase-like PLP-dependent enzyme
MDFHKYAFAAKGASLVLYRDKTIRRHQVFTGADWTGYPLINPVILSSRSGGALAATWAVLNFIGEEGYLELTRRLMEATRAVVAGVNAIDGLHVMGRPEFPLLAVGSQDASVFEIADEMKERGWHVQVQLRHGAIPESFHLTILPVNLPVIDAFLADLKASAGAAKGKPRPDLKGLAAALAAPGSGAPSPPDLSGLMKMAGIEGGRLPKRMALINELLNALPPARREEIFTLFSNELQG